MDSTPQPPFKPSSASKLPIKRKTPHSSSNPNPNPNPNPSPILLPKLEPSGGGDDDDGGGGGGDRNPPPFKFHRIWTEPDEIRFLQGLLDSSSLGLSFPRDLNAFYARFSGTMSQPYSKSQLSEKLRRLRKKFRVISARLARGMDKALLSPHDQALFDLSERLWHPDFSPTSPFGAGDKQKMSNLVGVKVSFSPVLPSASIPVPNQPTNHELNDHDHGVLNSVANDHEVDNVRVGGFDVKLSEVNIEFDGGVREQEFSLASGSGGGGGGVVGLGQAAAKTVINVFDECLKEVRMALVCQGLPCPDHRSAQAGSSEKGKLDDFERRWREQRVAELDVLARRIRLVLESSLRRQ